MEFLVETEVKVPREVRTEELDELRRRERERGAELRREGLIKLIWRLPGRRASVAIWEAPDGDVLHRAITSLPLWPLMDVRVRALARHPGTMEEVVE